MKLEEFLIQEEGDDSKRLPDGRYAATWDKIGKVWNIGPGLTHGVTKDTVWTQAELQAAEDREFAAARSAVASLVKIPLTELGENRTTVLESFTYNVGVHGLAISSVLRDVNARKFGAVPAALKLWNKAHGLVIKGLIKRRNDEIALWDHPDDVPPPPDLKTSKNVPPASFFETKMEPLMATATPAVPASSPVAANPLIAAAVQTATVPQKSLWTSITGMFSSIGLAGIMGFLSTFAPTLVVQILTWVGIAGSLVSVAAHAYVLFNHVSATNSATLMLAENLLNQIQTGLGGKPFIFENEPAPAS